MTRVTLTLRHAPTLRLDLRGVTPAALAGLAPGQVERLALTHGTETWPLAEFFAVQCGQAAEDDAGGTVVFEGELARCDRIGWQMAGGRILVIGSAGDYVGACMSSGTLEVQGHAGLLAACEMAGGTLTVRGDVGDHAASTLPGSMDGMRGGTLVVHGNAGPRFADRMRRGTALVFGDVGDFPCSRLVAGTVGIGGRAGAHVGWGMRRGSIVFAGSEPTVAPTFVPSLIDAGVAWQLLARDIARHGGPFAGLPTRRTRRHLGDLSADGRGELFLAQ